MWNTAGFLLWKWGITIVVFSHQKLGENSVLYAMTHLWQNATRFPHENKAKTCRIFAVEIWQWFQTRLGSIDWDHTLSKSKPQSLIRSKPQKIMPIACFQLPMSLNYYFTKTKGILQIGIMGCLTPSPYLTRLSKSIIKIFYPSTID